jgi:hypothetical protein
MVMTAEFENVAVPHGVGEGVMPGVIEGLTVAVAVGVGVGVIRIGVDVGVGVGDGATSQAFGPRMLTVMGAPVLRKPIVASVKTGA